MRILSLTTALALGAATMLLSGCAGIATTGPAAPVIVSSATGVSGQDYGGRQPITGASIQLWETGTSGYGAGATVLQTTSTDGNGMFSFASVSCTSGTNLYLTSTGGDPETEDPGENNTYATLMSAVTTCDNIGSVQHVWISEVTTVGTVWALSPFMNGTDIGAPASNQSGLATAFGDVNTLVDISNGTTPGPSLPTGATVPSAEINTIANALVSCVNSVSSPGSPSPGCSSLFTAATPPGGSAPADTTSAAIDIARNPGNNVGDIVAAGGSLEVYQPVLLTTPNDLTIAVLYTGNGSISAPSSVAVDGSGNVWITNNPTSPSTPSVTELSHTGADLSGTGYATGSVLNAPSSIAIDASGNAWIANQGNNSLVELSSSGAVSAGSPYTGGGLSSPTSIGFGGQGNLWVANSGNNSLSEFSSTGTAISPAPNGFPATGLTAPVGIALDPR